MPLDPQLVGRRISEAREAHGWTQGQLAKKMKASTRSVQRWEIGDLPRLQDLLRLAAVLDVPSYFLVLPPEELDPLLEMGRRLRKIERQLAEAGRAPRAKTARRAS